MSLSRSSSLYTVIEISPFMVQVTGLKGKINMQVTEISINGHPATSEELYFGQKIWKRKEGWEAEKEGGNREGWTWI